MTENEALEILNNECEDISKVQIALKVAREALEEIQQYRAIGTVKEIKIREAQFARLSEGYLNDLTLLREYQAIGTVEEFKALKDIDEDLKLKYCYEDLSNAEHRGYCQGSNEAVDDFAKFLHDKAKENNGLRLSSETRSWTHPSIFDYLEEFKSKQICEEEVEEIAEQMKAGGIDG